MPPHQLTDYCQATSPDRLLRLFPYLRRQPGLEFRVGLDEPEDIGHRPHEALTGHGLLSSRFSSVYMVQKKSRSARL